MKRTLALQGLLLFLLALGISTGAMAQVPAENDTEDADIQVNIAEKTAVDISPELLDYQSINPGTRENTTSDGFEFVELENIGSKNITEVWMNSTIPESNPFGSGLSSNYDAGNFIEIRPTGEIPGVATAENHTFVNRREYNESNDLSYILTETTENNNGDWRYGRFRVNDQEIFWAVNATSTGDSCTTTGSDLRVGNVAHSRDSTGTNDFTDSGTGYTEYALQSQGGEEVAQNVWVNNSQSDREYDVVAHCGSADTYLTRTRYNPEAEGVDLTQVSGGVADYLLSAGESTQEALQPGEHFEVATAVNVPQGVAEGNVGSGILRVLVNSN